LQTYNYFDVVSLNISKCPELVDLINTYNPEEQKGGCIRYSDGATRALVVDKEIELVIA
jgi:hypothetical protein